MVIERTRAPWLAWPFGIANLFSMSYGLLAVFNAWSRKAPEPRSWPTGAEPHVGIIIPPAANLCR
jgi:predicted small integral membrane protein